jgi:His-Xaa-Ser system protein HxsD
MQGIFEKGKKHIKLFVDESIYSLSSIYAAGYVFLDRAHIYLDKGRGSTIVVWLFPKDKKDDLEALGMEFYNELLNYAHYFSNMKANAGIIKALMQRALFSAAPSLVNDAGKKEIENLIDELEQEEKKTRSS